MSSEITPTYTEPHIFTIRGVQVMLDRDIAYQFGTETKFINRCVSRNRERFPIDFVFQLSSSEWDDLRFRFGTSRNNHGGRRYLPFAFTEQGVAMLATILKTEKAIAASIQIIRTFIQLRNTLLLTHGFLNRIEGLEIRQTKSEKQIDSILDSLKKEPSLSQGIFFNDQIFDAYVFVCEIIQRASTSIILIDNYVDETTLLQLSKRKDGVKATIYTEKISTHLQLDLSKHHAQYAAIDVKIKKHIHDRFLIIDNKELYHIGASLKDLGKKWFAFSRIDSILQEIANKI